MENSVSDTGHTGSFISYLTLVYQWTNTNCFIIYMLSDWYQMCLVMGGFSQISIMGSVLVIFGDWSINNQNRGGHEIGHLSISLIIQKIGIIIFGFLSMLFKLSEQIFLVTPRFWTIFNISRKSDFSKIEFSISCFLLWTWWYFLRIKIFECVFYSNLMNVFVYSKPNNGFFTQSIGKVYLLFMFGLLVSVTITRLHLMKKNIYIKIYT